MSALGETLTGNTAIG